MAKFEIRFFSIVLIGRQNPKIINHDFLVKNKILPTTLEPFKKLIKLNQETIFSEFISTPVLASMKYDYISIVVQEDRYQIVDSKFKTFKETPIIIFTKNYFGKTLQYTPFSLGGMNLNAQISYENKKDESEFDKSLGLNKARFKKLTNANDIRIGSTFTYPFEDGYIEVQIIKPKERNKPARVNFNYEFPYNDINSFMKYLDKGPIIYEQLLEMLAHLGVETN